MDQKVAEVIIDIPHGEVDRVFDYSIPLHFQGKIRPGSKVQVPFGHRLRNGFVWRVKEETKMKKIKPVSSILQETLLDSTQMELVDWLVKTYFCFHLTALQAVIPPEIAREEVPKESRVYKLPQREPIDWGKAVKQKKVWEYLNSIAYSPAKNEIERKIPTSPSTIRVMEEKGLITIKKEPGKKDPLSPRPGGGKNSGAQWDHSLRDSFMAPGKYLYRFGRGENVLPLYFSLIKKFLGAGKSVILLVPEASQGDWIGKMLVNYFPQETVLLHSDLSPQERYDQWLRIQNKNPIVLVGTRSAVFAPVQKPGLFIIHNQENEAFRQQENPRYITSEVAEKRIKIEGGSLLLVSSSPSLNSFYQVKKGVYSYIESPDLKETRKEIELIDMREEFEEGNISIFSKKIKSELEGIKKGSGKNLFFYVNRRGYAPLILCRSCGYVARCENCRRTMTLHKADNVLFCHHCKIRKESMQKCPECQSKYIRAIGIGTEKVAEEIKKLFPEINTVIVDSDRIKNQEQLEKVSLEIKEEKWEVIIGTRLILKEFFPRFDSGVMIMVDTNLNLPFYDSQENFFHLVSANASRIKKGKLFIQTYNPEQKTLQLAARNEWEKFMSNELAFRQEYNYPPVKQLLVFSLSGIKEKEVARAARKLAKEIAALARISELEMLGPVPAVFFQGKGKFRWQVSCRSGKRETLGDVVGKTNSIVRELIREGIGVNLEFNPKGML